MIHCAPPCPAIFRILSLLGLLFLNQPPLSAAAGPDIYLSYESAPATEPSPGIKLAPQSDTPGGTPSIIESAPVGKALKFDAPSQRLIYEGALDTRKPLTVMMIARAEFDPLAPVAKESSRWLFDSSGTQFRDIFRIVWQGTGLAMNAGSVFMSGENNGLVIRFSGEDLGDIQGKWLFIAFSVDQQGRAYGLVGDLSSQEPVLRAAKIVGTGAIANNAQSRFAIAGPSIKDFLGPNDALVDQAAIYKRALSPAELLGAFEAARAGQPLSMPPAAAAQAAVDALLKKNAPDNQPPQKSRFATSKMVLEFEDGWLTKWQNLETGETVNFGNPGLSRSNIEDRHYIPGPWWVDWKQPADPESTGTKWSMNVQEIDPAAARFTESAERPPGHDVQALQWGIRVPYDQIDVIHFPKGMPPTRLIGKNTLNLALAKSIDLRGRIAVDAGAWALRFYVIQGKTGGLLIYMEDPELAHYGNVEFKEGKNDLIISNRSIAAPPWTNKYTSSRWVIRQFTGPVNNGAQAYQDYLAKAYHLTKVVDRPTGWAKKLGYIFVDSPWGEPLPFKGRRRPFFNYTTQWEESIRAGEQWLENLAKVFPPDQVMFYTGGWKVIPNIDRVPDATVDPFFIYMCNKARKMGYHVMLHYNGINLTTDNHIYKRYWEGQAATAKSPIHGRIRNLYSNHLMGELDHVESLKGSWTERAGYNEPGTTLTMNPADEQWRYILVSQILAGVKATGADAIHIDVPVLIPDMNGADYGLTSGQGWREFGKLLRKTLDENDLKHVAIATEVTPTEGLLPYIDFAQAMRGKSIISLLNDIGTKRYAAVEENMIITQSGTDRDKLLAIREKLDAQKKEKLFNADFARVFVANMRELSEPSINNMVIGPFVQAYPHLGAGGPFPNDKDPNIATLDRLRKSLMIWASMEHDTPPSSGAARAMFMDVSPYDQLDVIQVYRKDINPLLRKNAKVLDRIDYGRFALGRFWGDQNPQILPPGQWQKEDLAKYSLKDGRTMRIYRADAATLRWELSGGQVLAELDVFEGWKNDQLLMKSYEPVWLKNQIDEFAGAK